MSSAEKYLSELEARAHADIERGSETLAAIADLREQIAGKRLDSNVTQNPSSLRGADLAKLPWKTNSRGQWAFAEDPEFKEVVAKIGTGKDDSFIDEDGFKHAITRGANGKRFINRSKVK